VINIQGDKYGGSCCVNLGIHPLCLPVDRAKSVADPKRLKEYECEFRCRLAPTGHFDKWWKYDGIFTSPERSADDLEAAFFKYGEAYFSRYSTVDAILDELSINKLEGRHSISSFGMSMVISRAALVAARIYACKGDDESKVMYAKYGLEYVGCTVELKTLLRELYT